MWDYGKTKEDLRMLFETKVALENYKKYLNELKLKDKEINFENYKNDIRTQKEVNKIWPK